MEVLMHEIEYLSPDALKPTSITLRIMHGGHGALQNSGRHIA
jgi:hypothetical protein